MLLLPAHHHHFRHQCRPFIHSLFRFAMKNRLSKILKQSTGVNIKNVKLYRSTVQSALVFMTKFTQKNRNKNPMCINFIEKKKHKIVKNGYNSFIVPLLTNHELLVSLEIFSVQTIFLTFPTSSILFAYIINEITAVADLCCLMTKNLFWFEK